VPDLVKLIIGLGTRYKPRDDFPVLKAEVSMLGRCDRDPLQGEAGWHFVWLAEWVASCCGSAGADAVRL
jgi:hypothetical protein